ncbi:MAG: PD-(D/E)XK nuclease family transposase [Niabella sp.]
MEGWLFVLKNMSRLEKIPLYLRKPVFEKLFHIAEYSKLNKEEKTMYDTSLKRRWDNQAALDYARHEGMERGIEKGIEKGKEQFVKNLLAAGKFTIAEIAKFAGVTEAFVKKVKAGKKIKNYILKLKRV